MFFPFKNVLFILSGIVLVVSAALYITDWEFIPYFFAVSSAGVAVVYLTTPYHGKNFRLKRLRYFEIIAALLLPVSSYLMFKKMNEWFLCLFISSLLQLYCVWVKEKEMKKDNEHS